MGKKTKKPRIKATGGIAPAESPKKKISGLDAAYQVLKDAGEPLNAKQIVERIFAAGLWKSDGKTPHATLYAAMLRECTAKCNESRFRKAERGHFTIAS